MYRSTTDRLVSPAMTPWTRLEVAPLGLLPFDGHEQLLEVAEPEPLRAVTFDDLVEDGRAVLDDLGEDLEEISLVVAVGQDAEPFDVRVVLIDLSDAIAKGLVIRLRNSDESHPALPQGVDGADDVVGGHGDVLHAGRSVEVEILLDL